MKKIVGIEVIDPGSNPDVDSDFNTKIRGDAIQYVTDLYGNTASIVTFGTAAAKKAFKSMCTIYEIPFSEANKSASLIPGPSDGKEMKLEDIFNPFHERYSEAQDFRNAVSGEEWKPIIEGALAIEGRNSSTGVHACGIIISNHDLKNVAPIQVRQDDGLSVSQWKYPELEAIGLIKMDFLGLDTVDIIQNTVENIQKSGATPPNMLEIIHGDMNDPKTFELFSRGDTMGIFQLSGDGVRDLLRLMKPDNMEDIIATTALYRPGPMGMQTHMKYVNRKNGAEKVEYPIHPDFKGSPLEEILATTYGLAVYQEQVMQIANRVAGMTLQEGDDLRSAMGKKKVAVMEKMKPKFFSGAIANGYSEEAVTILWDTLAEFAKYGFNRCLHGRTRVVLENGRSTTIERLFKDFESSKKPIRILSMFEDGEIRPHQISRVVKTERKPVWTVKTAAGRQIKLSKEHRLLTIGGYGTIEDGTLAVGTELIVDGEKKVFRISEEDRTRRKNHITENNKTSVSRERSRQNLTKYQSQLTFEDRSAHQKAITSSNPERHTNGVKAAAEKVKWLWENDPEWQSRMLDANREVKRSLYNTGRGFGKTTVLSDGRIVDSIVESLAAEYLIERGVDFELHKKFEAIDGRIRETDFYADGIYFEMDGLGRGREYFENEKYGKDIPFVYLTPTNYIDEIDSALMRHNIKNGDKIVEIIPPKRSAVSGEEYTETMYDIEMENSGPANFIANGIVSHNSHSVAYGIMAYQSAYLKANYPKEFMAALLSQYADKKERVLEYLKESRRMGLKVGPLDINTSDVLISPAYSGKYDIVFGFSGAKAISESVAQIIVDERNANGDYTSVQDFMKRVGGKINKQAMESVALGGAFDSFGVSRRAVVEALPNFMASVKTKEKKGVSLFDKFGSSSEKSSTSVALSDERYTHEEMFKREADTLGLYLSGHPLSEVKNGLLRSRVSLVKDVLKTKRRAVFTVVGAITDLSSKSTRRGRMLSVTIDDGHSSDFLTARASREVIKAISKRNQRDNLMDLYRKGEVHIADEILQGATAPGVYPVPEIEKNGLYLMRISFRPAFATQPYFASIDAIRPLHLSDNGTLPYRIRISPETKAADLRDLKALAKKYPGETNIHVAEWRGLNVRRPDADPIFKYAVDLMRGEALHDDRKPREWPPEGKKPKITMIPRDLWDGDDHSFIEAVDASLRYKDTGLKISVTNESHIEFVDRFGFDCIDFGIPLEEMLGD